MSNGYVYLATDGQLYKIGMSVDPDRRIPELRPFRRAFGYTFLERYGSSRRVSEVHRFHCVDFAYAERFLHHKFRDKYKGHEWFALSQEDVQWICGIAYGDEERFPKMDIPDLPGSKLISARIPFSLLRRVQKFIAYSNHGEGDFNPIARRSERLFTNKLVQRALEEYLERHAEADGLPREGT